MSNRNISWGGRRGQRRPVGRPDIPPTVIKFGSPTLLEISGPVQAYTGINLVMNNCQIMYQFNITGTVMFIYIMYI
jgi:hypothetical protein